MFCPGCGVEIKEESQSYCEKCGYSLSLEREEETEAISEDPVQRSVPVADHQAGGLFDLNRNFYVLKEKYWDWGSGDILDENNKIIGKMHRQIFSLRKKIELLEVNGTVSATIHEKIVSARGAQDLKDPEGNLIARIKKKILSWIHPKFFLEDPYGNIWYEARGEFLGWSYEVMDISSGKMIAEIKKADRWRDVFLRGLLDFQDTYVLRILDNTTDRRILVGFILSIDNVLHDRRDTAFGLNPYRLGRRDGGLGHPHGRKFPGGGGFPGPFRR